MGALLLAPTLQADIDRSTPQVRRGFYVAPAPDTASTITAQLSCDRLFAGAEATLYLHTDGHLQNTQPDFSALERDFTIHQVVSHHRDWLTPKGFTLRTEWTVRLTPRRLGEIRIPSLRIAHLQTEPILLTVQERKAADEIALAEHIRIETEAIPTQAYVHSQILYTVRMLYDEWLIEGNLSEPVFEQAYARQLGKHHSYELERNGHRLRVSERRYAVFPEKKGDFIIPGPTFSGEVGYPGLSEQSDTRCGTPLDLTGETTVINVLPPPQLHDGRHWLPSEQLTLSMLPIEQPVQLPLGEPLLRRFIVSARGLPAAALPNLPLPVIDGARVYLGDRHIDTQVTDDGLVARLQQTVTIIPTNPGSLTLPRVGITWWDTVHQRKRFAEIAAHTLTVLPAPSGVRTINFKQSQTRFALSLQSLSNIAYIFLLIIGAILAISVVYWAIRYRWRYWRQQLSLWSILNRIKRTYRQGNSAMLTHALMDWSKLIWPRQPPRSLGELGERLNDHYPLLEALDRSLYSTAGASWDKTEFNRLLRELRAYPRPAQTANTSTLAPLYPLAEHRMV